VATHEWLIVSAPVAAAANIATALRKSVLGW